MAQSICSGVTLQVAMFFPGLHMLPSILFIGLIGITITSLVLVGGLSGYFVKDRFHAVRLPSL